LKIKLVLAGLITLFFVAQPALAKEAADGATWLTSWEEAAKQSEATGKPILIDFTGSDWCGWCIKLKEEVFETDHFKAWAAEKVVLLEVDFPRKTELSEEQKTQNEGLAEKYDIQGFPTIIFADHNGRQISQFGYDEGGPEAWTAKAESGWAEGEKAEDTEE
jgi:protein disulfide-isomerase